MRQLIRHLRRGGWTGVLWLALALCAVPGRAQVIFSNFVPDAPSAGLVGPTSLWCISGTTTTDCGPATLREIAQFFTVNSSLGAVLLGSISLPLGCNSGTNGVIISLAQLAPGAPEGFPGNILESWTVTNLPCGFPPALTIVNDRLNITLQASAEYFVIVQPMAPDTLVAWYDTPEPNPVWYNNGSGWQFGAALGGVDPHCLSAGLGRILSLISPLTGAGLPRSLSPIPRAPRGRRSR